MFSNGEKLPKFCSKHFATRRNNGEGTSKEVADSLRGQSEEKGVRARAPQLLVNFINFCVKRRKEKTKACSFNVATEKMCLFLKTENRKHKKKTEKRE